MKKYFIIASDFMRMLQEAISGINESRLSSKPAHIKIQFLEEIAITVPNIKVLENRKICGNDEIIKDEGSRTSQSIVRSYIVHHVFLIFVNLKSLHVIHGAGQ